MPANSRSVLLVPAHHFFNISVYNFMLKFALDRKKYVDISFEKKDRQHVYRVNVLHEMQLHAKFMKGFLKYYVHPTYRESTTLVTARSKFFFQHHQAEYRDVPWGIFLRTCVQGAFVRRPIHHQVIQGGQEPSFMETKVRSDRPQHHAHHHGDLSFRDHSHHPKHHEHRSHHEHHSHHEHRFHHEHRSHHEHHHRPEYDQHSHPHDHHSQDNSHPQHNHQLQFDHRGHNEAMFSRNEYTLELGQQPQVPFAEYDEIHLYQMYLYFEEDLKIQLQEHEHNHNQNQSLIRNVPPIVQPIIDIVLHLVHTAIAHLTSYLQICTHPWQIEHLHPDMLPVPSRMEGFVSIRDILRQIVFVIDNDLCGRFQFELKPSAFYTNVILHTEILSKIHVQLLFTILLCIEARISGHFVPSRK